MTVLISSNNGKHVLNNNYVFFLISTFTIANIRIVQCNNFPQGNKHPEMEDYIVHVNY